MTTDALDRPADLEEVTSEEAEMAKVARRCLMASLDHSQAVEITLESEEGKGPTIALPPKALRFLADLLGAMSERKQVALVHKDAELSTVEAAMMLGVSRPFLIKEIEAGRLARRMVGTHRRIAFSELQAYQARLKEDKAAALARLSRNADELGLDY